MYRFFKIFGISLCLAVVIISIDFFVNRSSESIKFNPGIELGSDLSLIDMEDLILMEDDELDSCLEDVGCRIPLFLSAQSVQTELVKRDGNAWSSTTLDKVAGFLYETEIETLTNGEAVLLDGQVNFTATQLTEYMLTLVRPYMKEIEEAFHEYLSGGEMSKYDRPLLIKTQEHDGLLYGLKSFDSSYYESTFSPYGIYNHFLGGKDLLILFHEKPDRLFRVWVKEQTNGSSTEWVLMTIHDTGVSKEEVEHLHWQYEQVDEGVSEMIKSYEEMDLDVEETLNFSQGIIAAERARGENITDEMTTAEVHESPFITHIRTSLDNYLSDSSDGIEDLAIKTVQEECGLSTFDADYYNSPFILFGVSDGVYGGVNVKIIFLKNPDSIFTALVYQYGTGEMVLRSFCKTGPLEEKQVNFDAMMEEVITSKDFYMAL
jgi:hypothetical protein